MPVENLIERDRLAEIDAHAPEFLPELAQRAHQPQHSLLLLRLAGKLPDVGRSLDDALVAEIHRHEHHRSHRVTQEAAHRHRQHAGLGLEQPAGTAAPPLDEILDGMTAGHDGREVLHEHDGVQGIAPEPAADEKGPAHAQKPADDRQVEIDSSGDVRHRVAVDVDHVREQQVIHVAAVAGNVDDLVSLRHAFQCLEMSDVDAVVQATPQPGEHRFEETHEHVRIIGRDFLGIAHRFAQRRAARNTFLPHQLRNRGTHGAGAQQPGHDRASVRQVRSDAGRASLDVQRPQSARHAAPPHRQAGFLPEETAQRDRLLELHARVAAVEQHLQHLAQARGERPVLSEQQLEPGLFPLRRPSPVHRDGHQVHVEVGIRIERAQDLCDLWRRPAVQALVPETTQAAEVEVRMQSAAGSGETFARAGELEPRADVLQHRQIGGAAPLEHVAHRMATAPQARPGVLGHHLETHPQREQPMQQPVHVPRRRRDRPRGSLAEAPHRRRQDGAWGRQRARWAQAPPSQAARGCVVAIRA